jgi:uncharacterized membrane protein YfcA
VKTTVPASVIGVGAGSLVATHLPGDALRWIFCGFLAAPFGARLASRVPTGVLRRGFAILLVVLAIKLLVE